MKISTLAHELVAARTFLTPWPYDLDCLSRLAWRFTEFGYRMQYEDIPVIKRLTLQAVALPHRLPSAEITASLHSDLDCFSRLLESAEGSWGATRDLW